MNSLIVHFYIVCIPVFEGLFNENNLKLYSFLMISKHLYYEILHFKILKTETQI